MKILKYLLSGIVMLSFASCYDEPTGESTKVPAGSEDINPDDIVSPKPSFSCNTENVTVDPSKTYQEMEGIGASDCWLGEPVGKYWTAGRQKVADFLFSQKMNGDQPAGIGLSMWRVNLGAGSAEQGNDSQIKNVNNRAESYYYDNKYDWSKCVGQRYFMQQAKNNGVEKIILFANSPLVQWTENGLATRIGFTGNWHSNLKKVHYGDYAEYLAEVAQHFTAEGYNISHISPVNEPQHEWNGDAQEGSSWYNSEIAEFARELDKSLESRGLNTDILLGEAGSFQSLYSDNDINHNMIHNFFSPSSKSYVGDLKHVNNLISGHSYWAFDNWNDMRNVRSKVASAAAEKNLRVWQTEWSMLDACPSELEPTGKYDNLTNFDIAVYMSKVIHNDFTVANCTSWSYWTAMSVERFGQQNRFELIYVTAAGGQYDDDFTAEGTVEDNPNLWVLGNYSRFIRPGFVRIDLAHKESKDFFGSAWKSPAGDCIVAVYTNMDREKGVILNGTIKGVEKAKSVTTYTTRYTYDGSKQLTDAKKMYMNRFNINDNVFVEPYSVTTVVYKL